MMHNSAKTLKSINDQYVLIIFTECFKEITIQFVQVFPGLYSWWDNSQNTFFQIRIFATKYIPYIIVLQQKRQGVWKESAGLNALWKSQIK